MLHLRYPCYVPVNVLIAFIFLLIVIGMLLVFISNMSDCPKIIKCQTVLYTWRCIITQVSNPAMFIK